MEIKKHITAGCFLTRKVEDKLEVLLLYKKWAEDDQGWVPPKGHIEEGETIEETAIRETIEETGYKNIKIIKPLKTVQIQYPWTDGTMNYKTIHWFQAELVDDTLGQNALEPYEIDTQIKQEWFDIDTARKVLKFDDERVILDLLSH